VNTRGLYKKRSDSLFPGIEVLKKMKALDIPITVSSDAHKPGELALFIPETIELLKQLGFTQMMNFEKEWVEVSIK
jgi:histidinol-phosphatase (PHP family)